jgi:hypothetical protein
MNGRITRLILPQEFGAIAGEDGHEYVFHSITLVGVEFDKLALGMQVQFNPHRVAAGARAHSVRLVESPDCAA